MTRRRAALMLTLAGCAALGGCQTMMRRSPVATSAPQSTISGAPAPPSAKPPPASQPAPPPKSCVPRGLPAPPRYPDTDQALRAAAGAADSYQLMAAGRILRQQRLQDLEKVVAGCR